jgi:hypothetical protein
MSIFLGHIFEHSLNEIESVNAEIEGTDFDNKTKRKKDGVFYTQNILPSTLSTILLVNSVPRKGELGIIDEEYASRKEPPSHHHYKT